MIFSAPKISVVTPSFNQADYLEECIDSVLSQNYPNLEYIVMDGGSSDSSVNIIKKYAHHLSYWQSRPDGGQYAAINTGFARSSGEIMTWLNSDDIFHPGALDLVSATFLRRSDIQWLTGRPSVFYGKTGTGKYLHYLPLFSLDKFFRGDFDKPFVQQEGTFWRRMLWERAGSLIKTDLRYAGDLELWCRFFRFSQLHTIDALLGCFRVHSAQKTDDLALYRKEAEALIQDELHRFATCEDQLLFPPPPPVLAEQERVPDFSPNLSTPAVTVILRVKDLTDMLSNTLACLREQDFSDFELIVVGPSDLDLQSVVNAHGLQMNVRYLQIAPQRNPAAGCNMAIHHARGEFLAFLRDNDLLAPNHLSVLVGKLRDTAHQVACVDGWRISRDGDRLVRHPSGHMDAFNPGQLLEEDCLPLACAMFRKACLQNTGLFDESLRAHEDWDMLMRLSRLYPFELIAEKTCVYAPGIGDYENGQDALGIIPSSFQVVRERGRLYGLKIAKHNITKTN